MTPTDTALADHGTAPAAARFRWLLLGGAGLLAGLAALAWFTRADALFLELATAALAMCF